jgi:hypothetical protein
MRDRAQSASAVAATKYEHSSVRDDALFRWRRWLKMVSIGSWLVAGAPTAVVRPDAGFWAALVAFVEAAVVVAADAFFFTRGIFAFFFVEEAEAEDEEEDEDEDEEEEDEKVLAVRVNALVGFPPATGWAASAGGDTVVAVPEAAAVSSAVRPSPSWYRRNVNSRANLSRSSTKDPEDMTLWWCAMLSRTCSTVQPYGPEHARIARQVGP